MKCNLLIGFYEIETGETVDICENISAVVRKTGKSMDQYSSVKRAVNKAIRAKTIYIYNGIKCIVLLVKEK